MKYVAIFHANLNYAYLTPDRYEFVIRNAYEMIIDTMQERFAGTPYVFEASGYTIEQMAMRTPDVLHKLKNAIDCGQCEFMGSPYAHPMLANFPKEDGLWSLRFALECYEKYLGVRPSSFWNPECGWHSHVAEQVIESGYENLLGDFEAFSHAHDPAGKPVRPQIYESNHTTKPAFYNFSFAYDLPGDESAIHFPFNRLYGMKTDALRLFLRTDRVAQFGVRYFMGMHGYSLSKYIDLIDKYSAQPLNQPEGALIIFADDAEYIGTNGWFRLKYQNEPDRVFEPTPESRQRLIDLIRACSQRGEFITFQHACRQLPVTAETLAFDDDSAWHGARASTWATTPMARLLRPWQEKVRARLKAKELSLTPEQQRRAWFHLTNSYNSDGQWPPTLPEAPHIVHPYNYSYCFENLLQAELLVGGVGRKTLSTDADQTLRQILEPQQNLILEKAEHILQSGDETEKGKALEAQTLIKTSRKIPLEGNNRARILYPAEYLARANTLIEARRLVGGVKIENV